MRKGTENMGKEEGKEVRWHICACVIVCPMASMLSESWVTAHAPDG